MLSLLINRTSNRYYTLLSVSLSKFIFGFYMVSIGIILVHIGAIFEIGYKTQSLVFVFNSCGQIVTVFLIGYLSDRIKKKLIQTVSLALISAACVSFLYVNQYYQFLILFFIVGTLTSSINFTTDNVISNTFAEKKSSYLNIAHVYFGVGALLAPILYVSLYEITENFRLIFLVLTIVSAITLLLVLPVKYLERVEGTKPVTVLYYLKQKTFIKVCISLIFVAGTQMTISSWLPTLMQQELGIAPQVAAYSLSIFWFTVVIGRLIVAGIASRVGTRKLIRIQSGLLGLILIISGLVKSSILITAAYIAFGIVTGGLQPLLIAMALNKYKQNSGLQLGIIYSNASLGILLIPSAVGVFGDYYSFYNVIPFLAVLFFTMLFFYRED